MKKSKDQLNNNKKIDDLLQSAKNLEKAADLKLTKEKLSKNGTINLDSIHSITESIGSTAKSIFNTHEVFMGIYEKLISPIWNILKYPLTLIWKQYCKFWNRFSYYTDRTSGLRKISRTRSSIVVLIFIASLSIFTPTAIGDKVRFLTVEPLIDFFAIVLTKHTETFFLNHSEEIDPDNNVHAVRGCRFQGECTEQDAVYFRVKPRISHDFWKLINHGNPFYIPDHVVAPIAPGVNKCEVTYYGYRMTSSWISRLIRSLELYPTMLEAKCVYVAGVKEG